MLNFRFRVIKNNALMNYSSIHPRRYLRSTGVRFGNAHGAVTVDNCLTLEQKASLYCNFSFKIISEKSESVVAPVTTSLDLECISKSLADINVPNAKATMSLGKARLGIIHTPHGDVQTPNFVFCATKAAAKALTMEQVQQAGTQLVLSNTYHLMLTPGCEIVDAMGGLQQFTGWRGPMLTDSGGYQIFSMGYGSVSDEIKGKRTASGERKGGSNSAQNIAHHIKNDISVSSSKINKAVQQTKQNMSDTEHPSLHQNQSLISIDETGATFRSYVDGRIHHLTPERSMQVQRALGADLVVVLDECTPFHVEKEYTQQSMQRSHRWAERSLQEFKKTNDGKQALYGIVQGGVYEDLRQVSAQFCNEQHFFGIAIGGSLGASREHMHQIVATTRALLRDDKPIHLLGIGGVRDIFHGVRQGIDTFDCVHPTRLGRHGGALVRASFWDEEPNSQISDTVNIAAGKYYVAFV